MELKPCPCCGNAKSNLEETEDGYWRTCDKCGLETRIFESEEEANTAWSRRTEPPNEPLNVHEIQILGAKRGMPLWVQIVPDHTCQSRWVLVGNAVQAQDGTDYGIMLGGFGNSATFKYTDYGKTWLAYRRRP